MEEVEKTTEGGAPAPTGDEALKNLKAEMNRKLDNTTAELQKTNQQMQAILAAMQTPAKSETPPASKLSDLWYDKPDEAARIIEERTTEKLRREMAAQQALQTKQQQVITGLISDFPELQDGSHELTKKAVELYNALPEDEKTHPLAYKTVVKDAALDLGIKPKSKRTPSADDGFTMGSTSGSSRSERSGSLNQMQKDLAAMLGVKPEKVAARIKNTSDYKKWK